MLRKYLTGSTALTYDKAVQLACKPKAAPPKSKYLDPLIAATWDDGGALYDVCNALSPRLRDPNHIVVFKALIVLHSLILYGYTENVLSRSEMLRLSDMNTRNWDDHMLPGYLPNYAKCLDSRIQAYRDLEHDTLRVQAHSIHDPRTTAVVKDVSPLRRSENRVGPKLRSMTVEEGLFRETRTVQRMVDALVGCRLYLDDLEDLLTLTALRMLVKDLLILFQAENDGITNLLERFFEMSHTDATEALSIYRHFCAKIEPVVEYLGVARKLQNLLNALVRKVEHVLRSAPFALQVPISNEAALQKYLDDLAFEQNRIEYGHNRKAVHRGGWNEEDSKAGRARFAFCKYF
ncbi:ANTH domain-containing protein [Mycena capillaripes]|nr:ANTH domain-containing protein [Mycena capillaripes]